ncbi:BPSL0761 family protein [Paraburkholderia sp. A1BS-2L]|uniref:BPSL0761 family protein n=1 Tax=Paraburkholderia sp. A1BS-2L TaxID=3028373 RepID=UPI003DA8B42A
MTTPYERTQAVHRTHDLLKRLAAGEYMDAETLRYHASALLKHFPGPVEIDLSADASPFIWASMDAKWHD